jgi:hypothetical protein
MGKRDKAGTKKNIQTSKPIKITNSFNITLNLQLMGNNLFIIASRLLTKFSERSLSLF